MSASDLISEKILRQYSLLVILTVSLKAFLLSFSLNSLYMSPASRYFLVHQVALLPDLAALLVTVAWMASLENVIRVSTSLPTS